MGISVCSTKQHSSTMKFFAILTLAVVAATAHHHGEPGSNCPLTTKLESDHTVLTKEAAELGWYDLERGSINRDQIVADVGQEKADECQAVAQEVNGMNVADKVREFYGWENSGVESTPEGGPCFEDQVQNTKQVYFFDCLGLS